MNAKETAALKQVSNGSSCIPILKGLGHTKYKMLVLGEGQWLQSLNSIISFRDSSSEISAPESPSPTSYNYYTVAENAVK